MGIFDFFNKPAQSVIGIDIGSSSIKVVQIKKKNGRAELETYGELALGPYGGGVVGQAVALPMEKVAEALSDLMKEKEVNITTKRAGLSIPFSSSLMSVIEVPQVAIKQLATMVPLEARKYIPVPISEVSLDWSIIPKDALAPATPSDKPAGPQIAKLDVLVVAIHNDTIARYSQIVSRAGLEAGFFEIEVFSTMRAVVDEALAPVMIVDLGAASTKLYIIERGVIKASHTVNRGAQDITSTISKSLNIPPAEAEIKKRSEGLTGDPQIAEMVKLGFDYIFEEANRTLLAFEKKYNKAVSKVVLVGGGAALKGLAELSKTNFKTPAEMGNPFGKVAAPAFLEQALISTGPEFAVAIGLALRELAEQE